MRIIKIAYLKINCLKTNSPKLYRSKNFILLLLVLTPLTSYAKESSFCRRTDLFPSQIENVQHGQKNQIGSFQFKTYENQLSLTGYFYLPSKHTPNSPIGFLIHDHNRDAKTLIKEFAPIAERFNALIVAPEFSVKQFPKSIQFTLGVAKNNTLSGAKYRQSQWKQPYEFLYNELEHLFEGIKQKLNLEACGYFLYGHGAGAQFVQRMLIFSPDSRVKNAVAANADWYTLPDKGDGKNENLFMPYGLQGSPISAQSLIKSFNHQLTILIGEENNLPPNDDKANNQPQQAKAQGENRYERAINFFETAKKQAQRLKTPFNWHLAVVPKAVHDSKQMSLSSAWYLSNQVNRKPCTGSSQTAGESLYISEILADPTDSIKGDSNRDSIRDPRQDEFIEIINLGKQAICLSGWSLGTHDNNQRHVFPVGTQLASGKALVVFGGGIPKGNFGGAVVQWPTFADGLNLKRKGDGIVLFDNYGNLTKHLTWGDCDKQKCSSQHIQQSLDIGQSIVRTRKQPKHWRPHSTINPKQAFTPGLRIDGKPF